MGYDSPGSDNQPYTGISGGQGGNGRSYVVGDVGVSPSYGTPGPGPGRYFMVVEVVETTLNLVLVILLEVLPVMVVVHQVVQETLQTLVEHLLLLTPEVAVVEVEEPPTDLSVLGSALLLESALSESYRRTFLTK